MLIDKSEKEITLPKLGYQLPKQEIFIMVNYSAFKNTSLVYLSSLNLIYHHDPCLPPFPFIVHELYCSMKKLEGDFNKAWKNCQDLWLDLAKVNEYHQKMLIWNKCMQFASIWFLSKLQGTFKQSLLPLISIHIAKNMVHKFLSPLAPLASNVHI